MTADWHRVQKHRDAWKHRGQERPAWAVVPGPNQESVWDYPRPPAYVVDDRLVEVYLGQFLIAKSAQSIRALETGSPPAFYLPSDAFDSKYLAPSAHRTFCEWKGEAQYFDVVTPGGREEAAVWCYPAPFDEAVVIAGWLSCYPEKLSCRVGGEAVVPQEGRYYGGWVTSELVGPWKGEPGTESW